MTTFQAILFSLIHGFASFLPVSAHAHHILVPYFLGWPEPTGAMLGALSLGALLSLLIYFRHDWASMISTFLQVIIFRKRPMTLDERLPLFLAATSLPAALLGYYEKETIEHLFSNPLWVAIGLVGFGILLVVFDNRSRRTKGMFDWNVSDSFLVGISQAMMFVPGCGQLTGSLMGGLARNYNREAAAKFAFYAALPVIAGSTYFYLHDVSYHQAMPMTDMSWFTFIITVIVTMFSGLLAIGGLMRNVQSKGFGRFLAYRILVGAIFGVVYWMRSRSGNV